MRVKRDGGGNGKARKHEGQDGFRGPELRGRGVTSEQKSGASNRDPAGLRQSVGAKDTELGVH